MHKARSYFDKESERLWNLVDSHPDQLHIPVRDDQWTGWMIAAHIVTATQGMIDFALAQLRTSADASPPHNPASFDIDRWNAEQVVAWNGRSVEELKAAWVKTTQRFDRLIAVIEQEPDPERMLVHPVGLQLKLADYLQLVTAHLRIHRQELDRGFEQLATAEEIDTDATH